MAPLAPTLLLLRRPPQVFDARCVIKICMNDQVAEAAQRLLENAPLIKQAVDLRGACIALDDCYEVGRWGGWARDGGGGCDAGGGPHECACAGRLSFWTTATRWSVVG